MTEAAPPSRFVAGAMAAIAFFSTLFLLLACFLYAVTLLEYTAGDRIPGEPQPPAYGIAFLEGASVVVPLMAATYAAAQVYLSVRRRRSALFNTCFFSGLALLLYAVWALFMLIRVFDAAPQFAIQAMHSSGLFTLCIAIPAALLLLSAATALSAHPQKHL